MIFSSKTVGAEETLAEILMAERKKQNLSLSTIARKLNIREDYLKLLEQGNYQDLPGEVYLKNFLKSYLKFLGLTEQPLLELYQREKAARQKMGQAASANWGGWRSDQPPRLIERVTKRRLIITPKIIRLSVIIIIIIICLTYLGLEIKKIVTPPLLLVEQPVNNLKTTDYFVEVSGTVAEEAKLFINGQEVLGTREGRFAKRLDLQEGINIIKISAVKKYSQPKVIYRQVLVISEDTE